MKILIVDDDEIFLDRMKKILTIHQYFVVTASSGEEALVELNQDKFDLILTDLKMPNLSGLDLTKRIREKGIDSIIIIITGYGTIESAVEAMKAGAYDYILKPFDADTLLHKIKEVETEIKLREDLKISKIMEKSALGELQELIDIPDYESPYLVISDEDPDKIIKKLNLTNIIPIWLNFEQNGDRIIPSKLHVLKSKIEEFVNKNVKGTIIFQGIEEILRVHDWDAVKRFLIYLQSDIITLGFSLLIILKKDTISLDKTCQTLLQDALSLLINPAFNGIVTLLSHPIRKDIINLLKTEKKLNFNKILKKLNIARSSILAFHINKLEEELVFEKVDNFYSLSSRGLYFAEIISLLEKLGFSDPHSRIKIFKDLEDPDFK